MQFKFLNLKHVVVNVQHISRIYKKKETFVLDFNAQNISGILLWGSGSVSSETHFMKISKETDPEDYQTVADFVKSL